MWSPTSEREAAARAVAGVIVGVGLVGVLFVLPPAANPAHHVMGLGNAIGRMVAGAPTTLPLALLPPVPHGLAHTVVYEQGPDGAGVIVGRCRPLESHAGAAGTAFELELSPDRVRRYGDGAALRLWLPPQDLGAVFDLVLWPDTLGDEAQRLHAALQPVLETHVYPKLEAGLRDSLKRFFVELAEQDEALLAAAVADLIDVVKGEVGPFAARLVVGGVRALGVPAILRCLWNKGLQVAENGAALMTALFSGDPAALVTHECMDEADEARLKAGLRDEIAAYWRDRGADIRDRVGEVMAAYEGPLVDRVKARWLPAITEVGRAVWRDVQGPVSATLSAYARDVAARRFLTVAGGPRLGLAYAIRSLTGITDRPLLVIEAAPELPAGTVTLLMPEAGAPSPSAEREP